jgi:transcriptional regulator with PAS, ATPase and Fis domain
LPSAAPEDASAEGPARVAAIPLTGGASDLALVVEWRSDGAAVRPRGLQNLAVYASVAGASLARARAAAVLGEVAAREAAMLGAVRDGVVAIDRDGVARAANQAAASALGVRRDDLLGYRLGDVPGLAPLARALSCAGGGRERVVALPRGNVLVRCEPFEGGTVAILRQAAAAGVAAPTAGSAARFTFDHLIGEAPAFVRVREDARRAADTELPILVWGESGTGKELLAQAIHNASSRASFPFVGINVTAIPRDLLESELFGYEGGAFTGARSSGRPGKFELAGRGTVLLDEIADMPMEMQSKLLRVLQERVVQRLGATRDVPVRARIIATSQRDLREEVKHGRFRLDLFHRLRVVELRLPPLRARPGDVRLLVERQLRAHAARGRRGEVAIAPNVLAALEAHAWPGNVRELTNLIEGELGLLAPGERALAELPRAWQSVPTRGESSPAGDERGHPREVVPLAEIERRACRDALAYFDGNVARAARALGVAKATFYTKMRLYGLRGR